MKQLAMHTNKIEVLERKVDTLEKLYGCQLVWRIERREEKMSKLKSSLMRVVYKKEKNHKYKMYFHYYLYHLHMDTKTLPFDNHDVMLKMAD
jgi:hypothetical protein